MSKEESREGLPFEPKNRKKPAKKQAKKPVPSPVAIASKDEKNDKKKRESPQQKAIPEEVSNRMIGRMVLFSGVPLLMALFTFIGSYFIITNEVFPLPNQAVVLVSAAFLGMSVIGLSYGIFSASWDEGDRGSVLGLQEFSTNFGRMREAWRSAKPKK